MCRTLFAVVFALLPVLARAGEPEIDRNPDAYLILGLRSLRLKDLAVVPPPSGPAACSVGVNCATARHVGRCGMLSGRGAVVPAPGQVVSDHVCLIPASHG